MPTVREVVNDAIMDNYDIFASDSKEAGERSVERLTDHITRELAHHGIK